MQMVVASHSEPSSADILGCKSGYMVVGGSVRLDGVAKYIYLTFSQPIFVLLANQKRSAHYPSSTAESRMTESKIDSCLPNAIRTRAPSLFRVRVLDSMSLPDQSSILEQAC
jgi:hypothetical protein